MHNSELLQRSLKAVWHPCTQMKQHAAGGEALPLIPIARGEGLWLYDFDGNRYLDAISSWWVNLFGHANARIKRGAARPARNARTRDHRWIHAAAGGSNSPNGCRR